MTGAFLLEQDFIGLGLLTAGKGSNYNWRDWASTASCNLILRVAKLWVGGNMVLSTLPSTFACTSSPFLKSRQASLFFNKVKLFLGITGFWVSLHSPICSLSLLFSLTKFSTNKIFPTSAKKKNYF
jgi:hypothetical protein